MYARALTPSAAAWLASGGASTVYVAIVNYHHGYGLNRLDALRSRLAGLGRRVYSLCGNCRLPPMVMASITLMPSAAAWLASGGAPSAVARFRGPFGNGVFAWSNPQKMGHQLAGGSSSWVSRI